ncbi:DUF2812 domain-containing protein [Bacillus sp. Marseille-P3661]|uniref:DUF2812 domain-containing protein n=1 Tax=Bacillus sp. Marseille-P3661 TaxID=1936234 RepID=UPI000C817F37|nr:DUF2812 domain-containing protein [Bacillus sp. Marseille-P3661]
MTKIVRKFRSIDNWRIGEHESWFTDMAAEGLHLKKVGVHFAHFIKGEPKKMRYRIDVTDHKKILTEQKLKYVDSGWDYVTSYGFFNVFSSPVESNSPELYSDPVEQSFTLKKLDKKFAWSATISILITMLMIGLLFALLFLDGTPTLALVEGQVIQQTVITIFVGYSSFTSLQAALAIRALRKSLLEGKPINHSAPWKKQRRVTTFFAIMVIIITLLGTAHPFIQLVLKETKTLPLKDNGLPIVRLADVEQNAELIRPQSTFIRDGIDWGNRYSYDWSLLAPVQYVSDEIGHVPNQMWKDGSGEYLPTITTRIYQLRYTFLSENVVNDLIKRYSLAYQGGEINVIKDSDFDILMIYTVDNFKEVFAAKGKQIMYIRYHGHADLDSLLVSVEEKMKN